MQPEFYERSRIDEDPTLYTVSRAFYWTLQAEGVDGDFKEIQYNLAGDIDQGSRRRINVKELNGRVVPFLPIYDDNHEESRVDCRLLLKEVTTPDYGFT